MFIPPKQASAATTKPDFCLKPEFEQAVANEFLLAQRHDKDLSLLSFKITLNDSFQHDDYVQRFDEYVNLLLDVIARRLRRTDIACKCSSLHVVVMCRHTARQHALAIAGQIQQALCDLAQGEIFSAFGVDTKCLSIDEDGIDRPGDLFACLLAR